MNFFLGNGWKVQFLQPDGRTCIGRIRTFATAEKIRDLIARTPIRLTLEEQAALDYAIQVGRGGLFLQLTQTQYARLWT